MQASSTRQICKPGLKRELAHARVRLQNLIDRHLAK
jgi:hypothetical protein